MPSIEPSPRPWRVEQPGDECRFWTIRNQDGISVCTAWREADAALIVNAVNERDRLRDQLAAALRLADECSRDAAAVHAGRARAVEEAQSEANRRADRLADIARRLSRHLANYITSESENDLLREARSAIGEGQP